MVFIAGDIKDLVLEADKHLESQEDPDALLAEFEGLDDDEIEEMKRDWERSHKALAELSRIIPNFQKKIDESEPGELSQFYALLQVGANNARSEDLHRIRKYLAEWLNHFHPMPSPLLDQDDRKNRGLGHDLTGRLLCPVEFNWDDLDIRAKLRACHPDYDWLSSYHARCLYAKYTGDARRLEDGFLKSPLLLQVFKCIYTSPSSAKGTFVDDEDSDENAQPAQKVRKIASRQGKPARRNVATQVGMTTKVTPRSIAYAAVQLHFNLQASENWSEILGGFDYRAFYNYIVDFFEDVDEPAAKKRAQALLSWWSTRIFPAAAIHHQPNTVASRKAMKAQRAARI
ncbi:hypothetical protein BDN70DRAFT_883565 [Pholiota conissans]|uniref:Uncharacterized protein n=1 Tax=Pholiota conissans TaxID=109636 RepID=A0A9P5YX65_9AGAR|nr:hypothetical protein BDN70DRAFT_883565 [Pholiota conissans]